MSQTGDGVDDECDTVCASSQDSCSTVSLLSDGEPNKVGNAVLTQRTALWLTECNFFSSLALQPARVQSTRPALAHNDTIVVLRLHWRLRMFDGDTVDHFGRHRSSLGASTASLGSSGTDWARGSHGCSGDGGTSRVRCSAPLYVIYHLPAPQGPVKDSGAGSSHRIALSLPIGRVLLREAFTPAPPAARAVPGEQPPTTQCQDAVEATVSRHHAELTLFFRGAGATSSGSLPLASCGGSAYGGADGLSCHSDAAGAHSILAFRSLDLTDFCSNTTVNGVPLSRHHRYHFTRRALEQLNGGLCPPGRGGGGREGKPRSSDSDGCDKILSVGVGHYATLDVYHCCTHSTTAALSRGSNRDMAVAVEPHEEEDEEEEAVLVQSKSRTTPSSAAPTSAGTPRPLTLGRHGKQPTAGTTVGASARKRQRAVETIVSSATATTTTLSTVTLEDQEESLMAHMTSAALDTDAGIAPPLGKRQQERLLRDHPLPRRSATGGPSDTGAQRSTGAAAASPHDASAFTTSLSNEEQSTPMSTPSSMRNSTWSETFLDSFADDDAMTPHTTQTRRHHAPPLPQSDVEVAGKAAEGVATVRSLRDPKKRVVYTTGLRLDAATERRLGKLGIVVSADLKKASAAEVLVVQRPLMRSVKLLTVLPYVDAVVHHQWLDEVLERADKCADTSGFGYKERRTATSIEGMNGFVLEETLRVPPATRQALFSDHTFWVHADAKPQQPPLNDLKSVITSSGGKLTKHVKQATVLVLPSNRVSSAALKRIIGKETGRTVEELSASHVLLIDPDQLFRAVLQQKPLQESCVDIGSTPSQSQQPPRRGSGRRSAAVSTVAVRAAVAPAARKSTRRSSQQPPPSQRRRSTSTSAAPPRKSTKK